MKSISKFLNFIFTISIFLNYSFLYSSEPEKEIKDSDDNNISDTYLSLNLLLGSPVGEFADIYNSNILVGLDADVVFSPVHNLRQLEIGAKVGYIYAGSSSDFLNGVFVETDNEFFNFSFLVRLRPFKGADFEPFFEATAGRNLSYTETTYRVDDDFFSSHMALDDKITINDFSDWSNFFSFGLGIQANQIYTLKFTYQLSPIARYVREEDVFVNNDIIEYSTSVSKIQIFNVSIGINMGGLFNSFGGMMGGGHHF